jgi:hypothetical protein
MSGEFWSDIFELLHTLLDIVIPDPSYALYIPQFTVLNVGDGVQVNVISDAQFGIINGGTINNNGTITAHNGGVIATASILNSGTIINNNVITGDDDDSPFGIINSGAIDNNYGSYLSGSNSGAFNSAATGIFNSGIINNLGELIGLGSSGWVGYTATAGQGIYNDGTINNLGSAMPHDFYIGMFGISANPLLVADNYGIYNDIGTINDYCHTPWSYSSYDGAPQNIISCNSYHLEVDGLSTALAVAAEAGSFVSWGPFVIPGYVGLGPNGWPQAIYNGMATGPLTYSFPYNVSGYTCRSGCYGTVTLSSDTSNSFVVTYMPPLAPFINTVNGMHLPWVTTAHLDARLTAALNFLDGGNTNAAVSQLNAFIHYVNSQTPRKISQAQAQQLITYSQAIISAILS